MEGRTAVPDEEYDGFVDPQSTKRLRNLMEEWTDEEEEEEEKGARDMATVDSHLDDDDLMLQDDNRAAHTHRKRKRRGSKSSQRLKQEEREHEEVDERSDYSDDDVAEKNHLDHDAVMNLPGFEEGALLAALGHLIEHKETGITFARMTETRRVRWVKSFLAKHYYN